jgi:hypothetical protein
MSANKVFLSSGVVEAEGIVAFRNITVDDLPAPVIIPALSRVLLTDGNTIDDVNASLILANSWAAGYIRLFLDGALVDSFPPLATPVSTTLVQTSATQIASAAALTAAGGSSAPDATESRKGILRLAGVLTGSADNPALAASGVSPGTYQFVIITVGADGRVVAIREGANTQINNLIGDVVGAPTANQLVTTGVNPGNYTNAKITVDAKGRVTFAASGDVISGREAVRLTTTANIVLSGNQVIDGVLTVNGDRILVKDQALGSENGIYIAGVGAWVRSADADTSAEVTSGIIVPVNFGTLKANTGWILTTANPIILNTTPLTFLQIWGFGGGLTAGQHEQLRQIIHLFDGSGPANGFTTGMYREINPPAAILPTTITWWDSVAMVNKIVEKTISYVGVLPSTITWVVYASDGVTVLETAVDTLVYSGVFEVSRTRAVS